ncbi:MAG TPA: hypothetical protein VNT30_25810 [Stellaceae bacterium]|nr:hypothetical protein [Stellaceae bacterium]
MFAVHEREASTKRPPEGLKLFADGTNLIDFGTPYASGMVDGFTTNPTLLYKADITATPDILKKQEMAGRDLTRVSVDTVTMFRRDAVAAGFTR